MPRDVIEAEGLLKGPEMSLDCVQAKSASHIASLRKALSALLTIHASTIFWWNGVTVWFTVTR